MARNVATDVGKDLESLRRPSWHLSRILDSILGTEEVVVIRRRCNAMKDYIYTCNMNAHNKIVTSGSKGEGYDFKSSDIDLMWVDTQTLVIESINDLQMYNYNSKKTVLLMKREGCNPGFVLLEALNQPRNIEIKNSLVKCRNIDVVSSILYRDNHSQSGLNAIGHGPCNTFTNLQDCDIAHCFECKQWPREAFEFIERPRVHDWPNQTVLQRIINRGCHLVAIGDKDSDISHIQWRLSFSAAEKDLIHSFNHTQFQVYGLIKKFLSQVINKIHSVKDLLCSYFMKTALFYAIEKTPLSFWRCDFLIPCFWFCINLLMKWVEQGHCPNYFVPVNNMFRNKVYGKYQQNLLSVLQQFKRIGWKTLYNCKDLQCLEIYLTCPDVLHSTLLCINDHMLNCNHWNLTLLQFPAFNPIEAITSVVASLELLLFSRSKQEEFLGYLFLHNILESCAELHISNINDPRNSHLKNKERYMMIKKSEKLMSIAAVGVSEALYTATYYYSLGQYRKAVIICKSVITRWKPFVVYASMKTGVSFNSVYKERLCGRGISELDRFRKAYAGDIKIFPDYKRMYPIDLMYDIKASEPFALYLPALPYLQFLLFLCYHQLGDIDRSLATFYNLQTLIRDNNQGCRLYPEVLNLLAICMYKLGGIHGAIDMCLRSQDLQPKRNGAYALLEKILYKVL